MRNWVADKFGRNRIRTVPAGPSPVRTHPPGPEPNITSRTYSTSLGSGTSNYANILHTYYVAWDDSTWWGLPRPPLYPDTLRLPEGV